MRKRINEEFTKRVKACAMLVSSHAKKLVSVSGSLTVERLEEHVGRLRGKTRTEFIAKFNKSPFKFVKHKGSTAQVRITKAGRVELKVDKRGQTRKAPGRG